MLLIPLIGSAYAATSSDTLDVFMIYSTPNQSCSMQEMEEMNVFVQSTKQYLDNVSTKKIDMSSICTPIEEIKMSEFPLLLKSLNIQRPDLLIILGDTKINEDMVIHMDSLGLWACTAWDREGECVSDLILSCTDCEYGTQEQGLETAVWTVSHELSHYFAVKQPLTNNYYDIENGVHVLQQIYDYCNSFNQFGPCEGMYYEQSINGQTFRVMNFDYILKNASEMKYFDISVFAHAESNQPTPEVIEEVVSEPEIIEEIILEPEIIPVSKNQESTLYQNSEFGFSILSLGGWVYDDAQVLELGDGVKAIVTFWDNEEFYTSLIDVNFAPNASIPPNSHDGDILDIAMNSMQRQCDSSTVELNGYTCSNFVELGQKTIAVNGQKSYQIKYSWTESYPEEYYENISVVTFVPHGDSLWYIRSDTLTDSYLEYEGQLNQIVQSFRVTNEPFMGADSQQIELTDDETNFLVNMIMNAMDSILNLTFDLAEEPALKEWGDRVIQNVVQRTENQIIGQLGYDPRVTCC